VAFTARENRAAELRRERMAQGDQSVSSRRLDAMTSREKAAFFQENPGAVVIDDLSY